MQEAPKVLGCDITYVLWDASVPGTNWKQYFIVNPDHHIEYDNGNFKKGIYRTGLTMFLRDKSSNESAIKFKIATYGEFYFNQGNNINEATLFGCLKYLSDRMSNFISHNRKDFGEFKAEIDSTNIGVDLYDFLVASQS